MTNIRSTLIIQIQDMNLKLNMKDINGILAKKHFNNFLNDAKKQYSFAETCLYEVDGSLPVMPSLLPVFCKCGEPWCYYDHFLITLFDHSYRLGEMSLWFLTNYPHISTNREI